MSQQCSYDYICVIDFEATCIKSTHKNEFYPHEIIEFPCVLIDVKHLNIKNTYHAYVKPTMNSELSDFCKNLTGISQGAVNNAEPFDSVLNDFSDFLKKHVAEEETFIVLSDGSWDMGKFLVLQCLISGIDFPSWARNWIDLKKTYRMYHKFLIKFKLETMLDSYGLKFEGRLHSGKDDAYNIARLVIKMMEEGCVFVPNNAFSTSDSKRLASLLSSYRRTKKKVKKKKLQRIAHKNEVIDGTCVQSEMDIDPDIIGFEHLILKNQT